MRPLQPLFFFTALILIIGLACSAPAGGEPAPVQAPLSTEMPPTKEPPAAEIPPPEPSTSQFFTEEFDSEAALANWESFSRGSGVDTNLVIKQEDDHLLFDLGDEELYIYYMYIPYEYDDVAIKLNADNYGQTNNNISLVCRMNSDQSQWYEFSVESSGLWYLYAVDEKYNIISNGNAPGLKQGKEINEYAMTCKGDEITLYIYNQKLKMSLITPTVSTAAL